MRALAALVVLVALAGCAAPTVVPAPPPAATASAPLAFGTPVVLPTGGDAHEPAIKIARDGTFYVTAAREQTTADNGSRVASGVWRSRDAGASWAPLAWPADVGAHAPGLEGDITLDASGRVYFADTYLADSSFTRWGPDGAWELTRPAVGSPAADDRPWLAAQGDGVVYYMSNGGAGPRIWLQTSTDRGLTWGAPHAIPGALYCTPAASPTDDRSLLLACSLTRGTYVASLKPLDPLMTGVDAVALVSHDRGATWRASTLAPYAREDDEFPTAAWDAAGHAFVLWHDGANVTLARSLDGGVTWDLRLVPTGLGLDRPWLAARGDGALAIVGYAPSDAGKPTASTRWTCVALVARDGAGDVAWERAPVDGTRVATGATSPSDFLQDAFAPDGSLVVAYAREGPPSTIQFSGVGGPQSQVLVAKARLG